ncbi:uncharacterized protein LOC125028519 [Penaeus chinensis]|uniref:uncharacterized protein LOC125028519 n=1 Tax=Penaeus chinensis TaxID=139456 RepID=UPI001FB654BE|nr:uncharacterized protein LOC125028519 [Penaeus chinensis]
MSMKRFCRPVQRDMQLRKELFAKSSAVQFFRRSLRGAGAPSAWASLDFPSVVHCSLQPEAPKTRPAAPPVLMGPGDSHASVPRYTHPPGQCYWQSLLQLHCNTCRSRDWTYQGS